MPKPAPIQRLGLLVFGLSLVALFTLLGLAEGVGHPLVPMGAVAVVEDVPPDVSQISEAEFRAALLRQAMRTGAKSAPPVGTTHYAELKRAALAELLQAVWVQGEATEDGISVSRERVQAEFEAIRQRNFTTSAAFRRFLETSHLTRHDLEARVRVQMLGGEIQRRLPPESPKVSAAEVDAYYEEAKDSLFTERPSREVRIVAAQTRGEAERAKAMLKVNGSSASWKRVAKRFAAKWGEKRRAGLIEGVAKGSGSGKEPLNTAIFAAPVGTLVGVVAEPPNGYYVFEVVSAVPAHVQTLAEVRPQIVSQLAHRTRQAEFSHFLADFTSKWTNRTFCAAAYATDHCANYRGVYRPPTASPACFREGGKDPMPASCPAPVQQAVPALPGTVSVLAPEGVRLAQRPIPSQR